MVGLAAITDLSLYAKGENSCQRSAARFMGTSPETDPQGYAKADPRQNKTPDNTVLLLGAADTIVDEPQGRLDQARSNVVSDAGHFDFVHPHTPAFRIFVDELEALL